MQDINTVSSECKNLTAGSVKVGQTVCFGSYEQGNGKEPIEWSVLEVKEGRALLLSRFGLDSKPFNPEYKSVSWASCSLRRWLNNTFLKLAFTESEREKIIEAMVPAEKNPTHGTSSGRATLNKVFLLSLSEASEYFATDAERVCEPTVYARKKGAYVSEESVGAWWWLRTAGAGTPFATAVDNNGMTVVYGYEVERATLSVRPALWVKL